MKFRCYAIPIVMALVATHQFYRVQVENLVSWRGGGFGMYASFHPRQHEVWVTLADSGQRERFTKYDENSTNLFRTVRHLLTWPNQPRVDTAFAAANQDQSMISELEVYRLGFDPETGVMSRVLLATAPQSDPSTDE